MQYGWWQAHLLDEKKLPNAKFTGHPLGAVPVGTTDKDLFSIVSINPHSDFKASICSCTRVSTIIKVLAFY